jgi:hypothetical protein
MTMMTMTTDDNVVSDEGLTTEMTYEHGFMGVRLHFVCRF